MLLASWLETDVSIRRAILLSLGELAWIVWPKLERRKLVPRLEELYLDDPDAGIHGADRVGAAPVAEGG